MKSYFFTFILLMFFIVDSFAQTNWTKYPGNPVLSPGPWGSWDVDLFEPVVIFDNTIYHMWYTGNDNINNRVGYATSEDGINWEKYNGNPVLELGPTGSWDDVRSGPHCQDQIY